MKYIILLSGLFISIIILLMATLSLFENEKKASLRLIILSGITLMPFIIIFFLDIKWLSFLFIFSEIALITYFLIPDLEINKNKIHETPNSRIDQRNIMFSRNKLIPGSIEFNEYYKSHPDKLKSDDIFRNNPGLLATNSLYYSTTFSEFAKANFTVINHLHSITSPTGQNIKQKIDPSKITIFIKNWFTKNGVIDIGFGILKNYHFYSKSGYAPDYGKPIINDHKYVISFLVEMNKEMISYAPKAPTVLESSHQYLIAATLSVALAKFIKNLGYDAQAHIDGKYNIVAPLVARDCNLGEIGRMGLLISNKMGPRVRIGIVTTDLPLKSDTSKPDQSVDKFCNICKKCAEVCPSQAIPMAGKKKINGINRWQINQENCYTLWTKLGTDCGKCIQVCPYSHPDNIIHNTIRFGIKNFPNFRKIAAKMDDIIYGK